MPGSGSRGSPAGAPTIAADDRCAGFRGTSRSSSSCSRSSGSSRGAGRAIAEERRVFAAERARATAGAVLPWTPRPDEPSIVVGTTRGGRVVRMPVSALLQHGFIVGPTGFGKTAHTVTLVAGAFRHGLRSQVLIGVSKDDLLVGARARLAGEIMRLPEREAEAVLDRVVDEGAVLRRFEEADVSLCLLARCQVL